MIRPIFALAAAFAVLLVGASAPAQADQDQSFVASNGDDNNLCIRSAPCLSLGRAAQVTLNEGVINCLDSGPILGGAISRAMTVDCTGTGAMVLPAVFSSTAITVSSNSIIDVKIRGLTLNGLGTMAIGIDHQAGGYLFVEDCVIENFGASPGDGIRELTPTGQTSRLYVADTEIRANGIGLAGGAGIIVQPSGSGSTRVVLERVRAERNTFGIFASGSGGTGLVVVQVRDSVAASSLFTGIAAFTAANAGTVSITVDNSSSLLNGQGISAQGPSAFVLLANSTVTSNNTGLSAGGGGALFSYQNNQLTGNVSDGTPTALLTAK